MQSYKNDFVLKDPKLVFNSIFCNHLLSSGIIVTSIGVTHIQYIYTSFCFIALTVGKLFITMIKNFFVVVQNLSKLFPII
jgi:hypothetical protein